MGSLLLSRPATVPRQAQRPDTLCNQQVRCSSHPTSSKKRRKLRLSMLFCCKNAENGVGQNAGQLLIHTVTHTRNCANRFKEYRRGGFAPSPIFLMFFFCSHHLCHETAHFLRGLLLHLPCGVGVGSQGEARVVVPEHGRGKSYRRILHTGVWSFSSVCPQRSSLISTVRCCALSGGRT